METTLFDNDILNNTQDICGIFNNISYKPVIECIVKQISMYLYDSKVDVVHSCNTYTLRITDRKIMSTTFNDNECYFDITDKETTAIFYYYESSKLLLDMINYIYKKFKIKVTNIFIKDLYCNELGLSTGNLYKNLHSDICKDMPTITICNGKKNVLVLDDLHFRRNKEFKDCLISLYNKNKQYRIRIEPHYVTINSRKLSTMLENYPYIYCYGVQYYIDFEQFFDYIKYEK